MWGFVEEEEEEWEKEEGRAEGVLPPEEDRGDEVSTGEEAVRGSDGRKRAEENRKLKQDANT